MKARAGRIGLALGSGSARGWAHIGAIRALSDAGIHADIVCGASSGALVAAAHASDRLDKLEAWVCTLTWRDIVRFMDVNLMGGGFIQGERLMTFFRQYMRDVSIEDLPRCFGAVATELETGREVWLTEGSLLDAVRASIALPGLFSPVRRGDRWLVDGGLVNPVPVSLCRALGAEVVIAINLNGEIVGKHMRAGDAGKASPEKPENELFRMLVGHMQTVKERAREWFPQLAETDEAPGLFEVMATSINIMQDRITKSRMAGDPPDVVLNPRLAHIGLLEFDRAKEAISEGRACVERMLPSIEAALHA